MLGSAGKLRVFRSDGTLVDSIDVSTAPSSTDTQTLIPAPIFEIDALGAGAMPF